MTPSPKQAVLEFGDFRLNPAERALSAAGGAPVQLTRRLYDLLLFMVERPGRLLEKQVLLDAVWKGAVVEENTLSRTVSALRNALGEERDDRRYIETVSGVGYRFVQPVRVTRSTAQQTEPAIAVLPFDDLSREQDQAYFAEGVAEEILNRLGEIEGLRVIAKSSAFKFRDRAEGAQSIGKTLGVDYLLLGAVRKEGRQLRVTAQLVATATDSQLWSERFDRELEEIFAIQDDIAHAVTAALRSKLGVDPTTAESSMVEIGTADLEAYDLHLRAASVSAQGGAHGMVRSAELYREAVTRDPKFAAAWLAFAAISRGRLIFAPQHGAAATADILEAVAKLHELAPRWWATHMAQSWPLHLQRDWSGMERALARARELAPGLPRDLAFNIGVFKAQVGELEDSRLLFIDSLRNDPLWLIKSGLVQMLSIFVGRYDDAEREYQRSLDLAGDREMVEHLALHRLWAQGKPFREQFRRYLDLTQTRPAPALDDVYTVADQPRLALEMLRTAAAAPENRIPPRQVILAWWLAAYGDADAAFDALWRSYVELRYMNLSWLWFPVLSRARKHARFGELTKRLGLDAYWTAPRALKPNWLPSGS